MNFLISALTLSVLASEGEPWAEVPPPRSWLSSVKCRCVRSARPPRAPSAHNMLPALVRLSATTARARALKTLGCGMAPMARDRALITFSRSASNGTTPGRWQVPPLGGKCNKGGRGAETFTSDCCNPKEFTMRERKSEFLKKGYIVVTGVGWSCMTGFSAQLGKTAATFLVACVTSYTYWKPAKDED